MSQKLERIHAVSKALTAAGITNTIEFPGHIKVQGGSHDFLFGTINGCWGADIVESETTLYCLSADSQIPADSSDVSKIVAWIKSECEERQN